MQCPSGRQPHWMVTGAQQYPPMKAMVTNEWPQQARHTWVSGMCLPVVARPDLYSHLRMAQAVISRPWPHAHKQWVRPRLALLSNQHPGYRERHRDKPPLACHQNDRSWHALVVVKRCSYGVHTLTDQTNMKTAPCGSDVFVGDTESTVAAALHQCHRQFPRPRRSKHYQPKTRFPLPVYSKVQLSVHR